MPKGRVPFFVMPFLVGGPKEGERIPEDMITGNRVRRYVLEFDGEKYRREVRNCWLNCNLVYWVWEDFDTRDWHPTLAGMIAYESHPDMREVTQDELYGSKKL